MTAHTDRASSGVQNPEDIMCVG